MLGRLTNPMSAMLLCMMMAATLAASPSEQPPTSPAFIFRFEADEFWLNLHHFLYVLGRAEAKMADASREAVAGAPTSACPPACRTR